MDETVVFEDGEFAPLELLELLADVEDSGVEAAGGAREGDTLTESLSGFEYGSALRWDVDQDLVGDFAGNFATGADAETLSAGNLAVTSPSNAPNVQVTSSSVQKSGSASRGGRKRVKDELEYLRQQVQTLETQLEQLRRESEADSPLPAVEDADSPGARPQSTLQKQLWELVAKRQLDAKHKALVENEKLRELIQSQLRVAHSLSRALRKRPDVSVRTLGAKACAIRTAVVADSQWLDPFGAHAKRSRVDTAESVFEALAEGVDALFAQTDSVVRAAGLSDVRAGLQGGVVKTDAQHNVFLEAVHCAVVPFGVRDTASALWKQMSAPSMAVSNGMYHAVGATEQQLRAEFAVTIRVRKAEAVIHERLVCKRVVEERRVVLAWCTLGDPEGPLLGDGCLRTRSCGWIVIEAATPSRGAGAERAPATLLKSVVHMTPEQNVSVVQQYVENMLLSEYLESAKSSRSRHVQVKSLQRADRSLLGDSEFQGPASAVTPTNAQV
ncbi:hypothetical protein PybrP1_011272, partial [[Pythium] brassicae (nom. inval.)]